MFDFNRIVFSEAINVNAELLSLFFNELKMVPISTVCPVSESVNAPAKGI